MDEEASVHMQDLDKRGSASAVAFVQVDLKRNTRALTDERMGHWQVGDLCYTIYQGMPRRRMKTSPSSFSK